MRNDINCDAINCQWKTWKKLTMQFVKSFLLSVLGLLVMASIQRAHCYKILAVFPLTIRSHFVMAESLMKGLASRGHEVDVVSHFPQKITIPNYTDISMKDTLPYSVNNVSITDVQKYPFVSIKRMAHVGGLRACSLLGHPKMQNILQNPPTDPPYDLVIVEIFVTPCYLALGRHLNVPIVGLSNLRDWQSESLGTPDSTAFVPNVFLGYSQKMNFWERLVNTLEHLMYSMQLDYYTKGQNDFVRKYINSKIPDVRELHDDLALVLVNSHHSMNRIRPMTPAVVEVAGLHLNDETPKLDPELENWLNGSEFGCVYFSTGSMMKIESFPAEKLEALYDAFRRIAPVRVLMKIANEKELLPGLPQNVMIRSWFSQLQILKHKNVRAFMSHGGIFGIQEAIYSAVPLIGIPLFGDQQANVDTFARAKILYPLSFSDITADNVERAIKTVLEDLSYGENIEKLKRVFLDRPMKPLDTAIYWIEYVVRNGDVLRSPALDIAWWKRSLLDVYAFLFLFILLVVYACLSLFVLKPLKYYRRYLGQRIESKKNGVSGVERNNQIIKKKIT